MSAVWCGFMAEPDRRAGAGRKVPGGGTRRIAGRGHGRREGRTDGLVSGWWTGGDSGRSLEPPSEETGAARLEMRAMTPHFF